MVHFFLWFTFLAVLKLCFFRFTCSGSLGSLFFALREMLRLSDFNHIFGSDDENKLDDAPVFTHPNPHRFNRRRTVPTCTFCPTSCRQCEAGSLVTCAGGGSRHGDFFMYRYKCLHEDCKAVWQQVPPDLLSDGQDARATLVMKRKNPNRCRQCGQPKKGHICSNPAGIRPTMTPPVQVARSLPGIYSVNQCDVCGTEIVQPKDDALNPDACNPLGCSITCSVRGCNRVMHFMCWMSKSGPFDPMMKAFVCDVCDAR